LLAHSLTKTRGSPKRSLPAWATDPKQNMLEHSMATPSLIIESKISLYLHTVSSLRAKIKA
jgi:hypothetical protein